MSLNVNLPSLDALNGHKSSRLEVFSLFPDIQLDFDSVAAFNKDFDSVHFQIGDELWQHLPENLQSTANHQRPFTGLPEKALYVVYQGRVRLLSFDAERKRDVSVAVLEPGDIIGTDLPGYAGTSAYHAVASTSGQIAYIAGNQLAPWLERLAPLREHFQRQIQDRDRLIFFKTCTALKSFSCHQLQELVPLLTEHAIPAGESLADALSDYSGGRFWLQSGDVQSEDDEVAPPAIGTTWTGTDAVMKSCLTQTAVCVYQLPVKHWETIQALMPPSLAEAVTGNVLESNQATAAAIPSLNVSSTLNGKRDQSRLLNPLKPSPLSQTSVDHHRDVSSKPIVQVNFPKPIHRRLLDLLERYPFIRQQSSSDCGIACLAMISRYWGKRLPIYFLRELADVSRAGTSLRNLGKTAERIGFQARPVRASFSRLADQTKPWIAHWQGTHYVVVYQVTGNKVVIADPAIGRRSITRQTFLDHWTGYALLLDPTRRLKATEADKSTISLGKFFEVLWPYRSLGLQVILISLLIQLSGLVSPLFTQIILDRVIVQKSLTTLHVFTIGAFLFGLWGISLGATRRYLLRYFSNRVDLTLISGFINHTLLLPLKFFESRRVGDILTRIQENQKIQRFLLGQVMLAWLDLAMGFVYLALMFYYNWRLTLLVLLLVPPIVIFTLASTPLLRKVSREIFNEATEKNSTLVEMLNGINTVKTAAVEREFRWNWEDKLVNSINARFRGQKLGITLNTVGGLINSVGGTALTWYGAMLVIQGELTIGQFVAFNMLVGRVISPVLVLANLWDELQEILISIERLNDVFSTEPEESPQRPMLTLPTIQGKIVFEDVTFRYGEEDERNTLQNLSFTVQAGQTVAIVGRSGSGKTTLVKLLQGFYHPNKGTIWIDGHDIRHVSPQSLRSQLGVVPQECFLFSGTITENITLYRSEFALEQVIEVAKLAEAHTFIQAMPLGYNTKVGERGTTLSGGQRQRIAIARSLLGAPRILILDEATSSLDTESERRFQRNLSQISQNLTTFIIAHRLSTVRNADCILVLDQGLLVEQGTHEELLAQRGIYYHLAQEQLSL
ncbi:MAG: cysteine peptidase family C39 domain-containing protein [Leptolyngbyaceae cyanobacterium]